MADADSSLVTIRAIAQEAGFSRQTVSDALRGTGRLSDETRTRILETAKRLGYRRDPLIAAGMAQMRRQPTHRLRSVLAFIETGPYPGQIRRFPTFGRIFEGVKQRAELLGYGLEPFWLYAYKNSRRRLESVLRARGINGVILLYVRDWEHSEEAELPFDPTGFACATVGARLRRPALHFASADHFGNTKLALEELSKLGCRRIGLVIPKPLDDLVEGRVTHAYYGWQRNQPAEAQFPAFSNYGAPPEELYRALLRWCRDHAVDAIYGLPQSGDFERLRVDLAPPPIIATLDEGGTGPTYGGTDQIHEAVGGAVVDMVDRQLSHGDAGIPSIARGVMVEGRWIPPTIPPAGAARPRRRRSARGTG